MASAPASPIACPYKGLAPFGESELDALLFFGRERDVRVVESNLVAARLTVLYGGSGVGKSSVVRAGVVRRLRALPERPVVLVWDAWGGEPAAALADGLAAAAGVEPGTLVDVVERAQAERPVYLVLDQSEEYFVYHGDDDAFERELAEVVLRPLRANVLLVVRDDALARLDTFRGLLPAVFGNLVRLDPLDRAAAEEAIVEPLRRYAELTGEQVDVEPALVTRILDEVAVGEIGRGLGGEGIVELPATDGVEAPYLQLVLERLWDEERTEGSAVLRLATLERLGGARRVVGDHLERAMAELDSGEQAVAAAMFAHLVTPSGTKIAHHPADLAAFAGVSEEQLRPVLEALLARRILRSEERGAYTIYHDVLAAEVLGWRRRFEAERAIAAERAVAARRHRRLAALAAGALAAAVVAIGLTVWALVERGNAADQATRAQARELDAVAVSLLPTDPQLGVLLAAEAARLSPTDTAEDVLRKALQSDELLGTVRAGSPVTDVASSGRAVIAGTVDGRTIALSVEPSGRLVRTAIVQGNGRVVGVDAVGLQLASITARGDLVVLSPSGTLRRLVETRAPVRSLALVRACGSAPRCAVVAAGSELVVVDARTGRALRLVDVGAPVEEVVAAGEGRVAVRARDLAVRLVEVAGGTTTVLPVAEVVDSIASDGVDVVVGMHDGRLQVWNAETGRTVARPRGQVSAVLAVAVARGIVLSGAAGGAAQVWDTAGGKVVPLPGGHANVVTSADLTRDGTFGVTGSEDATAKVWSTRDGRLAADLVGSRDAVRAVAFADQGRLVVTGGVDGTIALWNAETAPDLVVDPAATAPSDPSLVARAPDGAVARARGDLVVVTRPGGARLVLRGHKDAVTSVAFSEDGARVVSASRDHDPRVWDAVTGAQLLLLKGHFGTVSDARFSSDGRWIVTAGPITAGLWNARTGALVRYLRGPTSQLAAAAFDGDGGIVTSEADGTVRRASCALCVGIDGLLDLAAARLGESGRTLTDAERARYLLGG